METLQTILDWMKANPWITTAIVVYVIANLAPRPDPSKMTGWQKSFWQIIDRLCVLTADKLPGTVKLLLLDTPPPKTPKEAPKAPAEEPPDDTKEDDVDVDDSSEEEAEPDADEEDDKGAPT
jgi:hypothetical protein